jgi:hypothetical protein
MDWSVFIPILFFPHEQTPPPPKSWRPSPYDPEELYRIENQRKLEENVFRKKFIKVSILADIIIMIPVLIIGTLTKDYEAIIVMAIFLSIMTVPFSIVWIMNKVG